MGYLMVPSPATLERAAKEIAASPAGEREERIFWHSFGWRAEEVSRLRERVLELILGGWTSEEGTN